MEFVTPGAPMISRDEQKITHDSVGHALRYEPRAPKARHGTTLLLKLSAKMVDLSLQRKQQDSLLTDIPAHFAIKSEIYPPEPKIQLRIAKCANIAQEEAKMAAQIEHSGFVQASRELLRIWICQIKDHANRVHPLRLWPSSLRILVLTLLAFGAVYGFRGHHRNSPKNDSQIPTTVQRSENPSAPPTSISAQNNHNYPHTALSKSESRRRGGDYIAKDTYIYYGIDGKPSHTRRK